MRAIIFSIIIYYYLAIGSLVAQDFDKITIFSKELNQTREITIQKPIHYELSEFNYYDVFYVFDGQVPSYGQYVAALASLLPFDFSDGAIVVSIKTTYIENPLYTRNHDFLPSSVEILPNSMGNQEAFLAYIKNEVVPYVEANYRTRSQRSAVGHSLGASFLVSTMLNEPELFDNYICVSPNLAYGNEQLVKGLKNFDSKKIKTTTFFYMSHGEENINADAYNGWKAANDKAYKILRNSLASDYFKVVLEQYPKETHNSNFLPSVRSALQMYYSEIISKQRQELSEETYEITIQVKVPNKDDELYITGNQENLGNWKPNVVKMKKISPFLREIKLKVKDIAEFKFTRGSWSTGAWIKIKGGQSNTNQVIRPKEGKRYELEVTEYMDK